MVFVHGNIRIEPFSAMAAVTVTTNHTRGGNRCYCRGAGLEVNRKEGFNQVVMSISRVLLYFPLSTGMPSSEREYSDAGMSPVPE
jgi:hypothetical protein